MNRRDNNREDRDERDRDERENRSLSPERTHSLYDPGPNPQDVARRLGLAVPDATGLSNK